MVPAVEAADFMVVAQVCRAVAVATAAAAADHPMQIKRLHQPLPIREEIIIPTVIAQLHGQSTRLDALRH
jgi:hypothetical protein